MRHSRFAATRSQTVAAIPPAPSPRSPDEKQAAMDANAERYRDKPLVLIEKFEVQRRGGRLSFCRMIGYLSASSFFAQ
jgi:hypothetical protein